MKFLKALLLLTFTSLALAQSQGIQPFQPNATATTNVAVTGVAANITLPTAPLTPSGLTQYVFTVQGNQTVFIRCDDVTATTSNALPLFALSQVAMSLPTSTTTCSVISTGAGSTLYASVGAGAISGASAGAGGTGAASTQVQGVTADGAAVVGNPVVVGGVDGSGNVQTWLTDTNGNGSVRVMAQSTTGTDGLANTSGIALARSLSDAANLLPVAGGYVYNGATWDRLYGNTNGLLAQGNAASGATDSGNPVKVGGKYNSTRPTFTDGQRGDLQIDTRGNVGVSLYDVNSGNGMAGAQAASDGQALGGVGLLTVSRNVVFNGSTWDRQYSVMQTSLLASAARTTTQTGADTTNFNWKGIKVYLSVTSAGTGSITVSIQAKDTNGVYYTLLTGAAVTTNSTNVYTLYPGITATANVSASDVLSRTFRVVVTHNNANSITYSVAYDTIP